MVCTVPDACPWSRGSTAPSVVAARGAKKSALPAPISTSAGSTEEYPTPGVTTTANQANAAASTTSPATRSGRVPTRSEKDPPTGASRNGITAAGSVSRPAPQGEAPSPTWRSCATRKSPPKRAAYISSDASPAVANTRLPKNRSGRIAPGVRRSHSTKATSSVTPTPAVASTSGLVHPTMLLRTRAHTTPSSPLLPSAMPVRSRWRCAPWLSVRWRRASTTSSRPSGTLTQKIQRQPADPARPPPTSGPSAAPSPPTPPHAPSTFPRRCGAVATVRRVSVTGVNRAAPAPWATRAAMRASTDGASAAATEAAVNRPTPSTKTRRRPNRSPRAAPASTSTANVSV
jgi:hypothetical protein